MIDSVGAQSIRTRSFFFILLEMNLANARASGITEAIQIVREVESGGNQMKIFIVTHLFQNLVDT